MLALGVDAGQAAIGDANRGLVDFLMDDGSLATLADVRCNIKFPQHYGVYTFGSSVEGGVTDKIQQFNIAGTHYATSGVFLHQGCKDVWADLNISDPYVRALGWTGVVPGDTQGGLSMGCYDEDKNQVRSFALNALYTDSITGSVSIEYGYFAWQPRYTGTVGTSSSDPFVISLKDWAVSGPGTAYQAGVRVKNNIETNFFKGDPHERTGETLPARFVRINKLTDTYGSGPAEYSLTGCTPTCNFSNAAGNFIRLENSVIGKVNRGWYVILDGDFDTNFTRAELFKFAYDEENNDARSYGHTLEAASGTTITDLIVMYDTNTVKGAGTFTNLQVSTFNLLTIGRDNLITGTNVAGTVTIDASTGTTTITSVVFTGSPRAIITVGAGSTAVVSSITAPSGSTITGAGSLTYNGGSVAMPYTI